jgi:hypothetical protein
MSHDDTSFIYHRQLQRQQLTASSNKTCHCHYQRRGVRLKIVFNESEVLSVYINLLKPTGYVMHQQVQQLYALPTLYLCVLFLSENKQRLVPLRA